MHIRPMGSVLCVAVALVLGQPAYADLLVGSSDNASVLRFDDSTGAFFGEFVSGGSGGLNFAYGMTIGPDGNLYVSSRLTHSVLRYDGHTGAFIDTFVSPHSGGLWTPHGATFGPDGKLYIVGNGNDAVLRYDGITGMFLGVFASGGLDSPTDLLFGPDGNLYVSSSFFGRVVRYNGTTGSYMGIFASGGLNNAQGLAFGPVDGHLYVASYGGDRVLRFDGNTGAFIDTFISPGSGGLKWPCDITFGPDGDLYVQSAGTGTVAALRYDGTTGAFVSALVGSSGGQGYLLFNPPPLSLLGSCCAINDTCTMTAEALCTGLWTLSGNCAPNVCPAPLGACCGSNGICVVTREASCDGTWSMPGSCIPNPWCGYATDDAVAMHAEPLAAIDVLANDWDPDGVFEMIDFTQPSHGTVTRDGNLLRYAPTVGYYNTPTTRDTFEYSVMLGLATDTATVHVLVSPIRAGDDDVVANEDNGVEFQVHGNDIDPDGIFEISGFTQPANGYVEQGQNGFYYQPNEHYNNTESTRDTFLYMIRDGIYADTATVYILVNPGDDPPTLEGPWEVAVNEGEVVTFTVVAHDVDGDGQITGIWFDCGDLCYLEGYTFTYDDTHKTGTFSWETGPDAVGEYAVVEYRPYFCAISMEGSGQEAWGEQLPVSILVSAVSNHTPTIDSIAPIAIAEGQLVSFTVHAHDADGDSGIVAIDAFDLPDSNEVSYVYDDTLKVGSFSWVTGAGDAGHYAPYFIARDGLGATSHPESASVVVGAASDIRAVPGDRRGSIGAGFEIAFPNPYHPNDAIGVRSEGAAEDMDIAVYDVRGCRVRSLYAGSRTTVRSLAWDGRAEGGAEVASGLYYVRVSAGGRGRTRGLLLLK